jgi:hypothetical protein
MGDTAFLCSMPLMPETLEAVSETGCMDSSGGEPMGANSTQAIAISFMLIGFVLLACAFAGGGIIVAVGALVLLVAAAMFFMKCKPREQNE